MDVRFPTFGPLVLLLCAVAMPACNSDSASPAAPGALVGTQTAAVTAEPLHALPEFVHPSSCFAFPAFGLRLSVIVGGGGDVILRGLRFRLTTRTGASSLPEVIPISSATSPVPIPSSSSIPIPGIATFPSSPIPIPGSSPVNGLFVSAGSSRPLPFFLKFGCDVVPEGTLIVSVDASDRKGRSAGSTVRVRVGP